VVAEDLGELLCSEERARADRIVNSDGGRLWRRSRGLLRALLGRYLQQDPRSLRFATGEHGKPTLVYDAGGSTQTQGPSDRSSPRLSFNTSHSGRLALYAFGDDGAVGVDVEMAHRSIDEVAIAARALGAAEARRLQALQPALRRRELLRAWTRLEAKLKCVGVGIGGAHAGVEERGLWVAQLELGPQAAGALAGERAPRELRCWDWRA
jgi:4'-phosphopantetheinyl transferase